MKYAQLLMAALALVLIAGAGYGQPLATHAGMPGHGDSSMADAESSMSCADMAMMHKDMITKMKAMDSRLARLVASMNSSPAMISTQSEHDDEKSIVEGNVNEFPAHDANGSARVDAMAAVITELVAQRSAMHDEMLDLQPVMMKHMMRHMASGKMEGMKDCPMMGNMESKDATKHEEHH